MIKRNYGPIGRMGSALALASTALMVKGCPSPASELPENDVSSLKDNAPNIIFILADDLGYGDVSLTDAFNDKPSQINTPNIDAIAARGFNFANGYVAAPVCSPSRSGFITSRYPSAMGFESNPIIRHTRNYDNINNNEILPFLLKEIGYSTAIIGKWDLGGALSGQGNIGNTNQVTDPEMLPYGRGFDYFYGFLGGRNSFYQINTQIPDDAWHMTAVEDGYAIKGGQLDNDVSGGRNIREFGFDDDVNYQPGNQYRQRFPPQHLTDIFTTRALHYIETHAHQDKPFFLYLAHLAPHAPYHVPDHFYQMFTDDMFVGEDPSRRIYAAMIAHMDARIGEIWKKLVDLGIEDNTIMVFVSDNGGVRENPQGNSGPAYNGGLRGGKFNLFEGGMRVPFAFSWPAMYEGGQIREDIITSIDMMPTFLRAAGYSEKFVRDLRLDGIDLHPYLSGARSGPVRDIFFWRIISELRSENLAVKYAVRQNDLKYIFYREPNEPGQEYLFDLADNRGESDDNNLITNQNYASELAGIKSALRRWEARMEQLPPGTPRRE